MEAGRCKHAQLVIVTLVVEATEKANDFKVQYIHVHVLMDLPNGDLVAA